MKVRSRSSGSVIQCNAFSIRQFGVRSSSRCLVTIIIVLTSVVELLWPWSLLSEELTGNKTNHVSVT